MHFVRRDGNSTSKNMSHFHRIMRRGLSQNLTASNLMRRVEENQFRRRLPPHKIHCIKCDELNSTEIRRLNQALVTLA